METYTLSELMLDIRRALTHLYDWAYLEGSPLVSVLRSRATSSPSTGQKASELRQLLLRSIERLAPLDDLPSQSHPSRRYAALNARYVEQMTIEEVATCLGLGERQVYRELQAGIRALADIIRSDLFPDMRDELQTGSAEEPEDLSAELEALASGQQPVNLCAEVRKVAELAHSLAVTRRVGLHDGIQTHGLVVRANRIVLRQAILSLFSWAIRNASDSTIITYAVHAEESWVMFELIFAQGADEAHLSDAMTMNAVAPSLLQALDTEVCIKRSNDSTMCSLSLPTAPSYALLLIDDNRGFHRLVRRYLAGQPYQLLSAYDGMSGLELARTRTPDVIVLDVMVPDRDGWELIEALRQDNATRGIPIIVCTVLDQQDLAHSLSVAGYMSKPLSQSGLLTTLQSLRSSQE